MLSTQTHNYMIYRAFLQHLLYLVLTKGNQIVKKIPIHEGYNGAPCHVKTEAPTITQVLQYPAQDIL